MLSRFGNERDRMNPASFSSNGHKGAAGYQYQDMHPLKGRNDYRLAMHETNGARIPGGLLPAPAVIEVRAAGLCLVRMTDDQGNVLHATKSVVH